MIFPDTVHGYHSHDKKASKQIIIKCSASLLINIFPAICNFKPLNPVIPKEEINNSVNSAYENIMERLELSEHKRVPIEDLTDMFKSLGC